MDEYRGPFDGYVYKDSMGGFAKFLMFCALIVALGALFAFWPGEYQYYNAQGGILVRVKRYSGATEQYLDGIGWVVPKGAVGASRSEEHTSELQSRPHLVCRLLLEKKK